MIPISSGVLSDLLAQYRVEGELEQVIDPVCKIRGQNRTYCLKQFERPDSLAFQVAIAEHLQKKHFHHCQRFYKTQEGSAFAFADGCWYLLSNWIDGQKPNVRSEQEVKRLVQTLARFHRHATGLVDKNEARFSFGSVSWHQFRDKIKDRFQDLVEWEQHYDHPALRKAIDIAEKSLKQLHADDCAELADREQQKNTFVHGDYNYSNVIMRPNKQLTLIDMDAAAYQMRVYDLMHLIQRNWGVDADVANDMIREYHRIRNLSRLEFDVLVASVSFPAQFWRVINIARYHNRELTKKQFDRYEERYLSRRAALEVRKFRYTNL